MDKLEKKIRDGKGTFKDLHKLCAESGDRLADDVIDRLNKDFPNGNVPETAARQVVHSVLVRNHKYISEMSALVINAMYKKKGVGIKAVIPEYNAYVEDELVREIVEGSESDGAGL